MMTRARFRALLPALLAFGLMAAGNPARAQDAAPLSLDDIVGAVTDSIDRSAAALRKFTWQERSEIRYQGKLRSFRVDEYRYLPDGSLDARLIHDPAAQARKARGKRAREIETTVDEMRAFAGLYLPLSSERIRQAHQAGEITLDERGESARVELRISGYKQPGDMLAIRFDTGRNTLQSVEAVSPPGGRGVMRLTAAYAALSDGAPYRARVTVDQESSPVELTAEAKGHMPVR